MSQLSIQTFTRDNQAIAVLYDWILDRIQSYIADRVLEINSGQGTFSSKLLTLGVKLQLNATSDINRQQLREKFKDEPLIRGVHRIDFLEPDLEESYRTFKNRFSTVIALNDLENKDIYSKSTIDKANGLLQSDGHLILIGKPTTWFLPNSNQDIALLVKYNKKGISDLLTDCDIVKIRFFDFDGPRYLAVGRKH